SSGLIYRGMAGGFFGQVLAESLRTYFASTGAHILIVAGLLVSLLFTAPISLSEIGRRLPGWGNRVFNRARTLIPDRPVEEEGSELPRKARQRSSTAIRAVIEESLPEASAEPELDWPVIQPSRRPTPDPAEPITPEPDQPVVAAQANKAGDYILPDPAVLLS